MSQNIVIKQRGEIIILPPEEVLFAEAQSNYTIFHTKSRGRIVSSKCIKNYESTFLTKISRSVLVNKAEIKSISGDYIDVGVKRYIKISRRMKRAFLSTLMMLLVCNIFSQSTKIKSCDLGFMTFVNDTLYHRNSIDGAWSKTYLGSLGNKAIQSQDLNVQEFPSNIVLGYKNGSVKPEHLDRTYLTEQTILDNSPINEIQALRWDPVNHNIGLINVPLSLNFGAFRNPGDTLNTQWFHIPRSYSWFWDIIHDSKITSFLNNYNNGGFFIDTIANMIPGSLFFTQNTNSGPSLTKLEQGAGITYGYQTNPTTTYPYKTIRISANDDSPTNEINVLGGTYNSTTNVLNITGTNGGGSVNFDLSPLHNTMNNISTSGLPSYASTAAAAADGALTSGQVFKVPNGDGTSAIHVKD